MLHVGCGILVSQPGIKPIPPEVEVWSLNHQTSREVPSLYILVAGSWDSLSLYKLKFSFFPNLRFSRRIPYYLGDYFKKTFSNNKNKWKKKRENLHVRGKLGPKPNTFEL